VAALRTPLAGTPDEPVARTALVAVASAARLSTAAMAQVPRDDPPLRRLIQYAAWVGLTEEEGREAERLAARLSERIGGAGFRGEARGQRPILRERRSSAKANRR
jgi:hypothetical protein